jgi:hypothetical protein
MREAIQSHQPELAREAIGALGRLARPEATGALAELLLSRSLLRRRRLRELRIAAASALGRIPGDDAVGALAQAARSRDGQLRRAAQTALDRRAQALSGGRARRGGLAFRKVACTLGIDHGSKRIGLAISDPDGKVALPVGTLVRRGLERDLAAIRELVEARQVERIVVGPLHGRRLAARRRQREPAERLARARPARRHHRRALTTRSGTPETAARNKQRAVSTR